MPVVTHYALLQNLRVSSVVYSGEEIAVLSRRELECFYKTSLI